MQTGFSETLTLAGNLEKPLMCSSMGPNGGNVALDSVLNADPQHCFIEPLKKYQSRDSIPLPSNLSENKYNFEDFCMPVLDA
jgi:hypothetical protein